MYTNFGNGVRETFHTRRVPDVQLREPGHLASFIQNETIAIVMVHIIFSKKHKAIKHKYKN